MEGLATIELIDKILCSLRDGEWHDLGAITKEYGLSLAQSEPILTFLAKYGFIKPDKKHHMVRLTPAVLKFLEELQRFEENENLTGRIG